MKIVRLFLWLAVSLLFYPLFAQKFYREPNKKSLQYQETARQLFDEGRTIEAIELIRLSVNFDPDNIRALLLQAVFYEDVNHLDSAVYSYRKATNLDVDFFPNALFSLAKLESLIGMYAEADTHFTAFIDKAKDGHKLKEEARMRREKNRIKIEHYRNQVPFEPFSLGDSINTEFDEYLPSLSLDGRKLIFTRRYLKTEPTPHQEEDFFFSFKDSTGVWSMASLLPPPVNSDQNEGGQSISPDGNYLFFTACQRPNGMGSCDIFVSRKIDGLWDKPFNIGRPINTEAWEAQPCLAPDGRTLYFTSNRLGGYGNSDIWISRLQENDIWTEPENLGANINTLYTENSPFIHPDGQTLYFSSDGHDGLGGMDLYYCKKQSDGSWGKAINLGYPINTYSNEVTLIVNAKGDTAYFSSNHLKGKGGQDLYGFALYEAARPLAVSYMSGKVLDADNLKAISTEFTLTDLENGEIHSRATTEIGTGEFLIALPLYKNFALNIEKPGYLLYSENIQLSDSSETPAHNEIFLQPIKKGESFVLRNLFFAHNSAKIEENSMVELQKLVKFLEQNSKIRIEISGHTDHTGTPAYNLRLSEERAKAVKKYLEENRISADRMDAMGYGMNKPAGTNDSEEGRALNRRTEIKIL